MTIEQFKKIKSDFNKIIDTINRTKINGRDKYVSKFKNYDRHLKNTIEIPKAKVFEEAVDYTGVQILDSYYFSYESMNTDISKLNIRLYVDFAADEYNVSFSIQELRDAYSPAFEIKPTEGVTFDESYTSNNFEDFIKKFGEIYLTLFDGSKKLFGNVEDTATVEEAITEIIHTLRS